MTIAKSGAKGKGRMHRRGRRLGAKVLEARAKAQRCSIVALWRALRVPCGRKAVAGHCGGGLAALIFAVAGLI